MKAKLAFAELPKYSNYGRCQSGNYGAHTLRFDIGDISIWFSYETPVAFQTPKTGLVVRKNEWRNVTGKHLNWIDGGNKTERVDTETFKKLWNQHVKISTPSV